MGADLAHRRGFMISVGCIMVKCAIRIRPVGVATTDEELQTGLIVDENYTA